MQPFDLFKERLVRYQMVPEIPLAADALDTRPKPRRIAPTSSFRFMLASSAVAAVAVVFIGVLVH
jgi:hypothetical protein